MPRSNRFSIYDTNAFAAIFDSNPANPFSRSPVDQSPLYTGPVEYPKMFYHPQGEERIVVPGVWELNKAGGGAFVGEQREMIYEIAQNKAEEDKLLAEGWHSHPAKALRVRIEGQIKASLEMTEKEKKKLLAAIPQVSSEDRIKQLEAELAKLKPEESGEAA